MCSEVTIPKKDYDPYQDPMITGLYIPPVVYDAVKARLQELEGEKEELLEQLAALDWQYSNVINEANEVRAFLKTADLIMKRNSKDGKSTEDQIQPCDIRF